jgi:hypothetical protein
MRKILRDNEDFERFKSLFPKDWVNELTVDYQKFISDLRDDGVLPDRWFDPAQTNGLGHHFFRKLTDLTRSRYKEDLDSLRKYSEHCNNLLYVPNILALDFAISEKKKSNNIVWFDYGSGFGLMSIFLKRLGFDCFNYDNYTQMCVEGRIETFYEDTLLGSEFYEKYKIARPRDGVEDFDGFLEKSIQKLKYSLFINSAGTEFPSPAIQGDANVLMFPSLEAAHEAQRRETERLRTKRTLATLLDTPRSNIGERKIMGCHRLYNKCRHHPDKDTFLLLEEHLYKLGKRNKGNIIFSAFEVRK